MRLRPKLHVSDTFFRLEWERSPRGARGRKISMKTPRLAIWLEAALLLVFMFAASCGGGGGNSSTPSPTSTPQPQQTITVSVSPPSATVAPNGSQQYTATVTGTTNTGVTWS